MSVDNRSGTAVSRQEVLRFWTLFKVSVDFKVEAKTDSAALGRRMARLNYCKQADAFSKCSSPTWPCASSLQDNLTFFISPFHYASAVTQLEKDYLLFSHVLASFFFFFIVTATADQILDRNLPLLSGHDHGSVEITECKNNKKGKKET